MKVTKDVINDLYPLYVEKECSDDTRALVDEYLQHNPEHAGDLRRIMSAALPGSMPPAKGLDEVRSLREARSRMRTRSGLLGFAIFFSLAPLSFLHTDGKTYFMFQEAPMSALVYGSLAAITWIGYLVLRGRSNSL